MFLNCFCLETPAKEPQENGTATSSESTEKGSGDKSSTDVSKDTQTNKETDSVAEKLENLTVKENSSDSKAGSDVNKTDDDKSKENDAKD